MTNKTTEALKLAGKMAKRYGVLMCDENGDTHGEELYCVGIDNIADIIREALADHIADTGKMVGCAYCDTNLLAGSECSNCGRVTIAEPANTRSTSEYSEPVKQEPVACQFPRQPNNEGGWTIDAKFLNILVKDMADDEFAVGMEETEAVLLALERSYAEPIQPVKQEPVAFADKYGNLMKAKEKLESTNVRDNWYCRPLYEKVGFDADLYSVAGKLALELECLLLDTKDLSVVSKWWDSANDALEQWCSIKDTAPVSAEAIRAEALEEAAKLCDRHTAAELIGSDAHCALKELAAAIRGLK